MGQLITARLKEILLIETVPNSTGSRTETEHVAIFPPSLVVTVIVADPAALAVTIPEDDTVATVVLLDVHDTDLSVALDGETVATNVVVVPTPILNEPQSKLTLVTEIV